MSVAIFMTCMRHLGFLFVMKFIQIWPAQCSLQGNVATNNFLWLGFRVGNRRIFCHTQQHGWVGDWLNIFRHLGHENWHQNQFNLRLNAVSWTRVINKGIGALQPRVIDMGEAQRERDTLNWGVGNSVFHGIGRKRGRMWLLENPHHFYNCCTIFLFLIGLLLQVMV